MIEFIPDFPENVMAFRLHDKATKDDYEQVLIPAMQAGFERDAKLRVWFETAPDFTGYTLGAMGEDAGLGLTYLSRWERVAVVSDADWLRRAALIFRPFMPCPLKAFHLNEITQAKAWITAP
ncbi:MAG: STAS/SEC14 domain-containing protein [Asticcacaulis sp.]